jgi:hypothetical protein
MASGVAHQPWRVESAEQMIPIAWQAENGVNAPREEPLNAYIGCVAYLSPKRMSYPVRHNLGREFAPTGLIAHQMAETETSALQRKWVSGGKRVAWRLHQKQKKEWMRSKHITRTQDIRDRSGKGDEVLSSL